MSQDRGYDINFAECAEKKILSFRRWPLLELAGEEITGKF